MIEIGSEFMTNSVNMGDNDYIILTNCQKRYVLSGRTGLYLISQELKEKSEIFSIALPDYCCGSMVMPFAIQKFNIFFYSAFDLENIYFRKNIDSVLIMDYFGFLSDKTYKFAKKCKDEGKTIIIDATQTAFSKSKTYEIADYIVVSYRKWFDCLCAVVYSRDGFITYEYSKHNEEYNKEWRIAAELKAQYMKNETGNKQFYLNLFAKANSSLGKNYIGYKANESEILRLENSDSCSIRKIRRNNANFLIDAVKKISHKYNIQLLYDHLGDEDCPLFVPILVDEKRRNEIRYKLIEKGIYCPVHWPIDVKYPYIETAYHKREISLICDQRYDVEAMNREVLILLEALSC